MRLLFAAIALALLFGCSSPEAPPAQQEFPPGPEPSGAPAEAPPAKDPVPEAAAPQPQAPEPGGFPGKTLEEIAASGAPADCVVRFTYQNKMATARFHFKGTDEMRFEETSSGLAQCQKTITVIRDGRRYAGCEGKAIMPSCDWFRSDHSGGLPQQFRGLPADSVDCAGWEYDASIFATPGQSCSLG